MIKNQKILIGLVIIMIVVIGFILWVNNKIRGIGSEDIVYCQTDSECVFKAVECCLGAAVNKKYEDKIQTSGSPLCAQVCDRLEARVSCELNRCVLTSSK